MLFPMQVLCLASLAPALPFVARPAVDPQQVVLQSHKSTLEQDQGWIDPRTHGGRMLDYTAGRFGEPLNVIISNYSDPYILTAEGLHVYAKSIGFAEECFNLHFGRIHHADLGDGSGRRPELFLARQYYFTWMASWWGTCWESLVGGNHFRAWQQDGSGAWFLGVSKEENSGKNHDIAANGYNRGRDWLVDRAISGSRWQGKWWKAEIEWRTDLLEPGNRNVNHGIKQDGRVAVLTVHRMTQEQEMFAYSMFTVVGLSLMLATGYYMCTTYILYILTRRYTARY